MDVKELRARYAAGERDFCEVNLRGADLSGVNLRDANLSDTNLCAANLSNANLSGVNLRDADLSYANLCGVNLSGAYLWSAYLSDANLHDANLSGAYLHDANLTNANLSLTNLIESNLSIANLCSVNLSGADLCGANLINSNLSDAHLIHTDLSLANLVNADLSNTNLTNANLSCANLAGANFTNATLTGVKLDGTILAYQKISEQLQQENQTLTEQVKFLEEQLEKQKLIQDFNTASNQGINAPHKWNNFYFRSQTEIKIAEALDRTGVLFYPNSKARLNQAELRVNKESDFLVFHAGKFGILEVDGRDYHQIAADDHERDRLFKRHGIRVIERFDATRCWSAPEQVVEEFLEILSQA